MAWFWDGVGQGVADAIRTIVQGTAKGKYGEFLANRAREMILEVIETSQRHKDMVTQRHDKVAKGILNEALSGSDPDLGPIWVYYNLWNATDRIDVFGFRTRGPNNFEDIFKLQQSELIAHVVIIDGTTSYIRTEEILVKDDRRAAPYVY
jgi:hypothetical protein